MKMKKPTSPIKASTQDFTEIETVKDDVLLLKDYSACIIISSGTTNFILLSKDEQIAMIEAYAGLLNSLSFPIQILILSKKMGISSYVSYLDEKIKSQTDIYLKQRLADYKEFIQSVVKKTTILEKKFYFVIPFFPLEMGLSGRRKQSFSHDYVITRAKTSLYPKKDHLLRLLNRAGLGGRVLFEQEIADLFYSLYNPSSTYGKLTSPAASYQAITLSKHSKTS